MPPRLRRPCGPGCTAVDAHGVRFREDYSLATRLRDGEQEIKEYPLVAAAETAILGLADDAPSAFLDFAGEEDGTDVLVVQRLLARGYAAIAEAHAREGLEFLLADSRRYLLGDHVQSEVDTVLLIRSIGAHLSEVDFRRLEQALLERALPSKPREGDSPETALRRVKSSRAHRVRLLRSLPQERASRETVQ